jgi:Protein of unknown function (DUF2752)
MHIVLKRRAPGQIEFGIIYGGIVLLALLAGRFLPVLALAPSCVFKALAGVPCPLCASTRSIVYLSHGDVASAFFMNPLVLAGALAALVYLFYSLFTLLLDVPRIVVDLSGKEKGRIRALAALLILSNWLYLVLIL